MRIDPEFQALIPPLSDDEFAALELSIMAEGCRDAIVVWQHDGDDIIVDGHNRYAICTAAGLPYKTVTRDFNSRSEVMLWMIRNQLARRNLNDGMRLKLAWQLKEKIADVAEESHKANGGDKVSEVARAASPTSETPLGKVETAREIGKVAEVGKTKVYQYQYIRDNAPAELLERVHNGEITVNRAETFARELAKHPQPVIDLALRLADDSADKVAILARLYKSNGKDGSNATFDEIATNGGFHYGDEMDDWCDFAASSARQIEDALRSLEKYHQALAMQEKDAARDALKQSLTIRAASNILPDSIQVHHADCTQFLRTLPDESIDLILIDPPYYGVVSDVWDNQWPDMDAYMAWCELWMRESLRVMKPTASFYIWGAVGAISDSIIHQKLMLDKLGFTFRDWITWQKRRGRGNVRGWLYTREEVLWYVKDNAQYIWNVDAQYGDEPNQFKVGMGGYAVKSEFKRITNVWTDIPEQLTGKDTLHYTPKPQPALERIIQAHTQPGDLVLDFFSGSGSTGIAAQALNRRCILVDSDEQSYLETKARVGING